MATVIFSHGNGKAIAGHTKGDLLKIALFFSDTTESAPLDKNNNRQNPWSLTPVKREIFTLSREEYEHGTLQDK